MANSDGVRKLTERQRQILRLLVSGHDSKSAALEIGISFHTVNEHLREARRHLAVSTSREAARILAQVESGTPNNLGHKPFGVAVALTSGSNDARQPRIARLPVVGGMIVMLAAIAIAGLVAEAHNGRPAVRPIAPARADNRSKTLSMTVHSASGAATTVTLRPFSIKGPTDDVLFLLDGHPSSPAAFAAVPPDRIAAMEGASAGTRSARRYGASPRQGFINLFTKPPPG